MKNAEYPAAIALVVIIGCIVAIGFKTMGGSAFAVATIIGVIALALLSDN